MCFLPVRTVKKPNYLILQANHKKILMKLSAKIFSTTIFTLFILLSFEIASAATTKCPLAKNVAYQHKGGVAVFFVTKNCTKQVFSGPTSLLQRIGSWKKVKTVRKILINKISKDKNYTIYPINKIRPSPVNTPPTQTIQPQTSPTTTTNAINPIQNPATIVTSTVPKKFLTIIAVNKGAEGKYENNDIQIFDVAMWDNGQPTNPPKISVYKFDRTFDPFKNEYIDGGQIWVNYRESFNILNVDMPPSCSSAQGTSYYECSRAYLNAFKRVLETIVKNQPAEHYGIKYSGHGSDVGLFANTFSGDDSQLLLFYANSIIGKKLDFLDWSTNCDMGSFNVIKSQYRYADYILSSDLLRGGFNMDWVNDYYRLKPEAILDRFFNPSKTIKQSLVNMVNSERMVWETATTRSDMVAKQIKQSLSIYDSSKFEILMTSANLDQGIRGGDVLDYIRKNYPSLEQKFHDFRFHYISNGDFFPWNTRSNGFRF